MAQTLLTRYEETLYDPPLSKWVRDLVEQYGMRRVDKLGL